MGYEYFNTFGTGALLFTAIKGVQGRLRLNSREYLIETEHLRHGAGRVGSRGAGKVIKIGDDVVELNNKNIVGTNYSKVKPTQDWINMDEVNRYVQRLKAGETLSPVEIYEVPGKGYFIQDGHHRFVASQITGIPVEVRFIPGTGPVGLPNWMDVVPGLPD